MAQEKIIRKGKIQLTDEELAACADELAHVSIEETAAEQAIEAHKDNAKAILKELKLVLADLHGQRQALATKVATREEERSVPCSIYYDFDNGFRYIVSDDPNAGVLEREALSTEERQLKIKDNRVVASPDMIVEWDRYLEWPDAEEMAEIEQDAEEYRAMLAGELPDIPQVTNFDLEAEKAATITDQELLNGINSLDEISIEEDNRGMPDDDGTIIDGEIVEENLDLFYFSKAIIGNQLVALKFDYPEQTPEQLAGVALLDSMNEDADLKTLIYSEDDGLLKSYRVQLEVIDNFEPDELEVELEDD